MPTSDLADSVLLFAAAALVGLAVGIALYALMTSVPSGTRLGSGMSGTQRQMRRAQAGRTSSRPGRILALMPVLVPASKLVPLESVRTTLAERYARAGWPGGLDDDEVFALAALISVVAAAFLVLVIALFNPLFAPLGLAGLLLGPGLVSGSLNRRGADREQEISRSMPFVLDLLVLTMRAGAPLPAALERVALDYAGNPVGAEFRSVLGDLEMGVTMRNALENLAARVPIPDVKTFVDDLVQAQELGRPVADTLARLARRVRARRVQEATETAGRAKVMVLVPGMLVFMASLLLLFSPFIVRYFYGGYTSF